MWAPDGFSVELAKHTGGSSAVSHAQQKPWGGEVWYIFSGRYALKNLFVAPEQRLSDQSHDRKEETWLFQTQGWAIISLRGKQLCNFNMVVRVWVWKVWRSQPPPINPKRNSKKKEGSCPNRRPLPYRRNSLKHKHILPNETGPGAWIISFMLATSGPYAFRVNLIKTSSGPVPEINSPMWYGYHSAPTPISD